MELTVLKANKREIGSKGKNNSLRRNGRVPGVFYLKDHETIPIDVPEKIVNSLVFTAETHLVSLEIDGEEGLECIVKDVQFDPVTDRVVHFDLLGLKRGEKLQIEVPLRFIGNPVGVKEGGIVQQVLHKIDIECLPKDMPQHLDIDITSLKLGDAIHAGDLKFENLEILNSDESVIVAVTHPKIEKAPAEGEEVEGEEVPTEPELISKGKEDEEES